MKGPPYAVVQLPESQDPVEGLFMSTQTPATAGAEICWEPGSRGLGVGSPQTSLRGASGRVEGVRSSRHTLFPSSHSFPLPERHGNLILTINMARYAVQAQQQPDMSGWKLSRTAKRIPAWASAV